MHRARIAAFAAAIALALSLTALLANPVAAQELASGTWTGTLEAPGQAPFDIEFEVEGGDEPVITMSAMGMSLGLENVELVDEALHFGFDAGGAYVVCELPARDGGGFEGECVGDDGESGFISMTPPKD